MQDAPKAVWSIPYVFVAFFPSLKENFIAYRSSKVSSRPDCIFEIHQLWQSGFSRVYSNCCCNCSFEREIIKIGQSSHKMYRNNILTLRVYDNFKCLYKNVWKLIEYTSYICIFLRQSTQAPGRSVYICFPSPCGLSTLVKKLTVATRVMEFSSNEMISSLSGSVKCKQKEVTTYTLNSLACVEAADGNGVMLSGWHIVSQVSIQAWSFSRVSSHWWVVKQSVGGYVSIMCTL